MHFVNYEYATWVVQSLSCTNAYCHKLVTAPAEVRVGRLLHQSWKTGYITPDTAENTENVDTSSNKQILH